MSLRTVSRILIPLVIAGSLLVAAWYGLAPRATDAIPVPDDVTSMQNWMAPNFSLHDQDGRTVSLRSLHGREVILTFMYTHCADTCPLTAQKLRTVLDKLGPEAKRIAVVIVSTDPFGDDETDARAFIKRNGLNNWHFLLGSYAQLSKVWKEFYVAVTAPRAGGGQTHSAIMYFIGPSGHVQSNMQDQVPGEIIAQDLHIYLRDRHWVNSLPVAASVGSRAPAFVLPSLTGGTISLRRYAGKPLILNFWATICPPCTAEVPLLARTYLTYFGKVAMIGVDEEEPANEVSAFVKSADAVYPIALDRSGNVEYAYGTGWTPTTFFLDRYGVVRAIHYGTMSRAYLDGEIKSLLPSD